MELKLITESGIPKSASCSNCTFMELKLTKQLQKLSTFSSSNCTFMELKLRQNELVSLGHEVLIVPLWN